MDTAAASPSSEVPARAAPPREDRARRIAELAAASVARHPAPWRGGYLKAPVVSLPQELFVYRVENGRLIAELRELARRGGESLEGLGAREDELEVQRLLHGLLVAKAADPEGPILQELSRLGQQTDPLLITAEGVVVNGNRRLAAMRELLARDGAAFSGFCEIHAAVLPKDATAQDLEALEAALQMAPETKLAYGWINRRLKLRRQRDEVGLGVQAVVEASRLAGPEQLERELRELELVEDYLERYCGAPGRYSLVGDAERLFVGLAEQLPKIAEPLRATWRLAAFAMIHGRTAVKGPLDRHFPFAAPSPEQAPALVLLRYAEDRSLIPTGQSAVQPLSPALLEALAGQLSDLNRTPQTAAALFQIVERLRNEHLEQHTPVRLLSLAAKLQEVMTNLGPEHLDEHQRRILRNHLAAVHLQSRVLLGEAEARKPSGLAARLSKLIG